jgi:hypothetical protein
VVFGRQRPPRDVAVLLLLFLGFTGLALAFWLYTRTWAGLLLPLGYAIGIYATLRAEVRELELRDDVLLLRTFLREYPIPRAHVTAVVRTEEGTAIDVVNGARYQITPIGVDAAAVASAIETWLATGSSQSHR